MVWAEGEARTRVWAEAVAVAGPGLGIGTETRSGVVEGTETVEEVGAGSRLGTKIIKR